MAPKKQNKKTNKRSTKKSLKDKPKLKKAPPPKSPPVADCISVAADVATLDLSDHDPKSVVDFDPSLLKNDKTDL